MAIPKQALYDYWQSLDTGYSEGGGSVPYERSDQTLDQAFGEGTFNRGILEGLGQNAELRRDQAMGFTETYKPETGEVSSLSDNLASVLESDSRYIQRARTKADEESAGKGVLNSSMAAGAAEGAAIDRGLDVAMGDLEADKFNVGEKNRAGELRYDTASGLASSGQQQRYTLDQQAADTLYRDFFSTKDQQDNLETMSNEFTYNSALDWQKYMEELDKSIYENTEQRLQEIIKQNSLLGSQYLKGWAEIQSSDMSPEDKVSRLGAYNEQISSIRHIIDAYKDIEINIGSGGTTGDAYMIE